MSGSPENVGGLSREDIDEIKRLMNEATGQAMSLRDWFAGQAANGLASFSGTMGVPYGPGDIAKRSYEVADALLAARGDKL